MNDWRFSPRYTIQIAYGILLTSRWSFFILRRLPPYRFINGVLSLACYPTSIVPYCYPSVIYFSLNPLLFFSSSFRTERLSPFIRFWPSRSYKYSVHVSQLAIHTKCLTSTLHTASAVKIKKNRYLRKVFRVRRTSSFFFFFIVRELTCTWNFQSFPIILPSRNIYVYLLLAPYAYTARFCFY